MKVIMITPFEQRLTVGRLDMTPGMLDSINRAGVETYDDLQRLSMQELLSIRGISYDKAFRLERAMNGAGLYLRRMGEGVFTGWKPYPRYQPEPGMYVVAIQFHFSIIYDIGEWKDGEWVRLFEDDRVVAFMAFEPYKGEEGKK